LEADDRRLVDKCLAGHDGAFDQLVERFARLVHGVCTRMLGDRHEAEDVAQEVFLRAHRALRRWDGVRPLRGWLLAIAANRCRTQLGKRIRRPKPTDETAAIPDKRAAERVDADLAEALRSAVSALRDDYRQVFLLFHEQGLSYEEMASATGRPVGTLKTWLHRARAELLQDLRRRGWAPEETHDATSVG
jgi:RNA polymerase sigma-70 factor (ECF subfamily)